MQLPLPMRPVLLCLAAVLMFVMIGTAQVLF